MTVAVIQRPKPVWGGGTNHPEIVRLAELESTTLSLDLTECIKAKLDVGKYQLTVRSVDAQGTSQYQTIVKTFEVGPR